MKKSENIISDLNLLMLNIPDELTPLEKVRWIYIKAGELFSYDYTFLDGENRNIRFDMDYVDRFETCIEITEILNLILNNIDSDNISCKTVERRGNIRGDYNQEHVANMVSLSTGEKILIDLTLDLYLIQSGCKTHDFGFNQLDGDEDIISLRECEIMDQKMGLIKYGEYTDKKISDTKSKIYSMDFSDMSFEEIIDYKINEINKIMYSFKGFQEGKNYVNKLFLEILKTQYKEYNLKYKNGQMISAFKITNTESDVWYIFTNTLGLIKSSPEKIISMLDHGWDTRSLSLDEDLYNEKRML